MPDLLLELFSEEIPARMQAGAAADLQRLVTNALVEAGCTYEGAKAFATPRRLALHVAGLPARQPDTREERKGPRVGAPDGAIQGFLKSAGLAAIGDARIVEDKKGAFYTAVIEKPGKPTPDVIAALMPGLIRTFPWPKSMRWGRGSASPEALRWVRPLQSIVATFGAETEEPEIVPFAIGGIASGDTTRGHRFLAPAPFKVRRLDDYVTSLDHAKVVLDAERRADIIRHDARDLAFAIGLEVIEDEALLAEVAGLVEWPVVLMGRFDPAFLEIPSQVIRATIRANQKCFVTRRPDGVLAEHFVLVSNMLAPDEGAAIVAGNERVVRARLSDARFFWETDLGVKLESRLPKLDAVVFHEKLGTQGERIRRIAALAREIAPQVGADPALAERAAMLAKADLGSEMVGEFPELQGFIGRTYAERQGEVPAVAAAIEDHYRPQGPSDRVPTEPVSIAVALADKLDTLVGFWAIDEKPTGSKDPFALRRAALGVIRIVVENGLRLRLRPILFEKAVQVAYVFKDPANYDEVPHESGSTQTIKHSLKEKIASGLLSFFADRLKTYLRDKGARHDLIDAVFALPGQDDLVMVVRRVEALGRFLDGEDGKNLLAGFRRGTNILKAEEKRDGAGAFEAPYEAALIAEPEERALANTLTLSQERATDRITAEDFAGAMAALAALRGPVDAFFERVTVNADEPALRLNRLRMLATLRRTMAEVADFGRIAG